MVTWHFDPVFSTKLSFFLKKVLELQRNRNIYLKILQLKLAFLMDISELNLARV